MRVVVLGATGNVGTSVVEALAADDRIHKIVGIARRRPNWSPPKTEFVAADIARDPLAPHLRGADVVVHLAWLFQPTHSPLVTWENNAIGSLRVFDAVAAAGVPAMVYASSVGAYSSPHGDHPVDESWPTHSLPTAGYGREKAYVERLLDVFEREHPDRRVVRLRPGFIFKRTSATAQRRLFAGPFLPNPLVEPGRLPVLPYPRGLRFQALHSSDAAAAYHRAVVSDARGAFNVAADDVLDGPALAAVLGARPVALPRRLVRGAVAAAWHAHLAPADPKLLDLTLGLPIMDTTRARTELGWVPRWSAREAMEELLHGMAEGAGGPTDPLAADRTDRRLAEVATGVGERP
ncbi:MAG: NAD-dependent epimerase/dehydratase family protein [Actinomycetota bacterium]|nr:NAD-dependent epimerase/dehydratase family protein [Actinomycetota bacterium]